MAYSNFDISFDPKFNPHIKYTFLPPEAPKTSKVTDDITLKIHRPGVCDVSVPQKMFIESIKKALAFDRSDLPPWIQKIHKTVLEILVQTPNESEITKILKAVKSIENFINTVNEMDRKSRFETHREKFIEVQDQLAELAKAIDSIEIPKEADAKKAEIEELKSQLFEQLNTIWMRLMKAVPQETTSQSAAAVGMVYTETMRAAAALHDQGTIISPQGTSAQEVYLRPEERLVAKKGSPRAMRDESDILQLTHIMMPGTVLSSFRFQNLSPERVGYSTRLPAGTSFSSHDPIIYSPKFKQRILENFSASSKELAKELMRQEENFQSHLSASYEYLKDGHWHSINFLELRGLLEENKLKDMLVRKRGEAEVPRSFKDYCEKNPNFLSALKFHLSENKKALENARAEKLLDEFSQKRVLYGKEGGALVEISFDDLKAIYMQKLDSGETFEEFQLKISGTDEAMPFEKYCLTHEDFFTALNYDPEKSKEQVSHFTLVPDFKGFPSVRTNYLKCEEQGWLYKNSEGDWITISFKELQKLWLDKKITSRTEIAKEEEPGVVKSISDWNSPSVKDALETSWKLITPEIYSAVGDKMATPLTNVAAKPFVRMSLLHDLNKKEKERYRDFIFKFLSPHAMTAMVLTGRQQFLDLHSGNVGVTACLTSDEFNSLVSLYPNLEKEYEDILKGQQELSTHKFSYKDVDGTEHKNVSLEKFKEDYRNKKILFNTPLTEHIPGQTTDIVTSVSHHKALLTATNLLMQKLLNGTPTEFVFFDTDLVLGESNLIEKYLAAYRDGTRIQHIVPLRSAFLQFDLRSKPLPQETITTILEGAKGRRQQILDWADNKDSPIRKLLPKNSKMLEHFLKSMLSNPKYSLSFWRDKPDTKYDDITLPFIRDNFAKDISDLSILKVFWERLEKEIKLYSITAKDLAGKNGSSLKQEEVWNALAKRYKIDVKELQALNPDVKELAPEVKLNVPSPFSTPLFADTPEAQKQRLRIASELFPRVTYQQKDALIERENRLIAYLERYKEISKPLETPPALTPDNSETVIRSFAVTAARLLEFIKDSPMTTLSKQTYLQALAALSKKLWEIDISKDSEAPEKFRKLWEELKVMNDAMREKCVPTYENTLKVMYPLFADAQFLLEKLGSTQREAGHAMGSWDSPLEMVIKLAKEYPHDDIIHQTAIALEERIEEVKNPLRYLNISGYRKTKYEDAFNEFFKRLTKL